MDHALLCELANVANAPFYRLSASAQSYMRAHPTLVQWWSRDDMAWIKPSAAPMNWNLEVYRIPDPAAGSSSDGQTAREDQLATLSSAINEAWATAYPGEPAVTDIKQLCNRVKNLAVDRGEWVKAARALQADNNKLRGTP